MPKLRHIAIAAKDPDAMAEFYKKAFDFKEVRKSDGPLAYGYHLSDGTIDLAILRFKTDQIGKGLDYTGLHHFGILVEDVEKASEKLEGLGSKHYMDQDSDRVGGIVVGLVALPDSLGLLDRQPLHVLGGRLIGLGLFVDVGRLNREVKAGL